VLLSETDLLPHVPGAPFAIGRAPLPVSAHPRLGFTSAEWLRLAGVYGAIAALHVCGWGLFLYYSARHPSLVGLGFVAYMFGLRHAFDADHIAAVDDTVRFMLQKGKRPLGIGFFFSLGHSTIVLALACGVVFAAALVRRSLPAWQETGSLIGAGVSGTFLCVIGVLNLLVLLDIGRVWRGAKTHRHSHAHVDDLLARRGFLNRLFGQRLRRLISHSWQMYPLGLLFGLGFDTASEVGLLAMTAGASAGQLPIGAVLCLPVLFAAGMTLMDTTDGVLMSKAYDWAFVNPMRKLLYNLVITALSVAVALGIGIIELMQAAIHLLHPRGVFFELIARVDFGSLGFVIAGLFLFAWGASFAVWKLRGLDTRYAPEPQAHHHEHAHEGGRSHAHQHFH
jgi:high-affinity nickel-transport protein